MNTVNKRYKEQSNFHAATNPALTLALKDKAEIDKIKRNNNKKNPRTKKKQRRQPKNKNVGVQYMLDKVPHPCIAHYASALCDPRGTPEGACIPWGYPMPSLRVKALARGTFALGTTGKGFCQGTLAAGSDSIAVTVTQATSVGTNATNLSAFTNQVNHNFSRLPYTAAQIVANDTLARVVAQGIRVRYAGTEANRNGIVSTFESQDLSVYANNYDAIAGNVNIKNERPPPNGGWHSVNYSGPYNPNMAEFDTASNISSNRCLLAYVQGVAGDLYEWESVVHVEYTGTRVPGLTMSHSDPEMYAKVVETLKKTTVAEPISDNNNRSAFWQFFKDAGSSIFNYVKKEGMGLAMETVSNLLLPGSGKATRLMLTN